jgi:hypothetical protein
MRRVWTRPATVAVLAGVGAMGLGAVALAAHPVRGALYTGNSGNCAPQIKKQCVFEFRVSRDGRALRFVKKGIAISTWTCRGGGGEAIFGTGKNAEKIPTARIRTNGKFSGSGGQGSRLLRITGRFTGSGKTAVLKFAQPKQHCNTRQLNLSKQ